MSMSTGYVRTHIYIEDMRVKKRCLRGFRWYPYFVAQERLVAFDIRGKQITPAIASELSIFSENHDYNTYILKEFSVSW